MDISSLPKVSVTFQSKPLSQRYFDQHPEIHHLYPSSADFKDKILKGKINVDDINNLSVYDIYPDNWSELLDKKIKFVRNCLSSLLLIASFSKALLMIVYTPRIFFNLHKKFTSFFMQCF